MSLARRTTDQFPSLSGFFDDLFGRDAFNWGTNNFSATNTTIPAVNIKETNEHFEVEVAAPGMKKEDFSVQLDGNTLTISSETQRETSEGGNDEKYSRREFSYQSFQRRFLLPKDVVDEDKIAARYENGILKLEIPKREEARKKGPRLINIA